ncbi:hypothetical protein FA13DRAFT_1728387 [Coprinellus micaceus]|uniref:G-protein coupled receptors family 1 profile domain-containing protein n=1 Tax=Coprinellus micaceus TaxID=71717 RepID=A0A4Y7TMX3_COPMI|nr:hypothetical protein FA13DRAFT_1728387 [Coprinellus micaceus]
MAVANAGSANGLAASKNPNIVVHGDYPQLITFLVFNMFSSHAGLPILLAIILIAKGVQRHPTFANLCVAFIIVGFSSTLLLYASAITGPEPPEVLCLLQASLLYGMPTLTSTAAFMLVWQMFLRIYAAHHAKPYQDDKHIIRLWIMLTSPYVMFFIPVLVTAVIGANNHTRISRNRRYFYCSLDCLPLTNAISIVSASILFGTILLIAWTIYILVRHRILTKSGRSTLRVAIDLSFPIRIMVFGLYLLCAMSLSLLSISSPSSPVPDLVIAFAGLMVIIIFGTQRDIMNAICFWRRGNTNVIYVESDVGVMPDLRSAFDDVQKQLPRSALTGAQKQLPALPDPGPRPGYMF